MRRLFFILLFVSSFSVLFSQSVEDQIRSILDNYDFGYEGNVYHKIYKYSLPDGRTVYLVFTSSDENQCHGCTVKMSVFVVQDGQIQKSYIGEQEVGSWGEPPADTSILVYPVGDNFMIVVKGGFLDQGYFEEYITCFYPKDDSIKDLGTVDIAEDNSGAILDDSSQYESWTAKYMFVPNDDKIPDLILNISGKKGGERFTRIERYYFNGKKYVKAE